MLLRHCCYYGRGLRLNGAANAAYKLQFLHSYLLFYYYSTVPKKIWRRWNSVIWRIFTLRRMRMRIRDAKQYRPRSSVVMPGLVELGLCAPSRGEKFDFLRIWSKSLFSTVFRHVYSTYWSMWNLAWKSTLAKPGRRPGLLDLLRTGSVSHAIFGPDGRSGWVPNPLKFKIWSDLSFLGGFRSARWSLARKST